MRRKATRRQTNTARSGSDRKRYCILVVGMHRSGTSALTRVFSLLGCDLPTTIMKANNFNEAGYWESDAIFRLNDRILESAGTKWHDWQEFYPDWIRSPKAGQFHEEALTLLQSEFGASHLFIFKDPRLCRILPFWLKVLEDAGVRPLILSPIRNPLEVAASLARRNGFDPSLSTLVWLRNVLDAESASRGVARFYTTFDGLQTNWSGLAQKARSKLGVVWPRKPENAASEITAFLSQELHHHRVPAEAVFNDPAVSGWLASVYQILTRWADSGERAVDFGTLDRIKAEFAAATPAISQLIAAEQKATRSLADKEKKAQASLAELSTRLQQAEAASTEARNRLAQTESALVQRRHEADQTAEELAKAQAQLKQILAANVENEKLIAGLKEHTHLLLADYKERQSQIESLDKKTREQEQEIAELRSRQKEYVDETVTLSRLVIDREQQARAEAERAGLIRDAAAKELGRFITALLDSKKWPLLPRRARLKRRMALLERTGLFDRDWYLRNYQDVRESGIDPLRHFAEHGAREGRAPNSKFELPKQ